MTASCSGPQLSDGLGVENLRALKNLCYDLIPKPQLEAIDSGLGVFNVLIEQSEQWEGGGGRKASRGAGGGSREAPHDRDRP